MLEAEAQVGRQLAGIWSDYGIGAGSVLFVLGWCFLLLGNRSCTIPEPETGEKESAGQRITGVGKNQPNLFPGKQGTFLEAW